ncbi:MAG: hypothetical protein H6824_15830 [Planctomycetaceae bacterium]|nr:hypothetical protein [Planctomycetaceae bacterium]
MATVFAAVLTAAPLAAYIASLFSPNPALRDGLVAGSIQVSLFSLWDPNYVFAAIIMGIVGAVCGSFLGRMRAKSIQSSRDGSWTTLDGRTIPVLHPPRYVIEGRVTQIASIFFYILTLPLFPSFMAMAVSFGVGMRLRYLSQRMLARPMNSNSTNLYLLLRPFRFDTHTPRFDIFSRSSTYEELLVEHLSVFGRVVTIGNPRDRLHLTGAERIYSTDGHWQTLVDDLLKRADGVFLVVGATEGVEWELQRVREVVAPGNLAMYLPVDSTRSVRSRDRLFNEMRSWVERCTSIVMPNRLGPIPFVIFDEDWTGHLVMPRKSEWPVKTTKFLICLRQFCLSATSIPKQGILHWRFILVLMLSGYLPVLMTPQGSPVAFLYSLFAVIAVLGVTVGGRLAATGGEANVDPVDR